jgi:hypothetical protein
MQNAGGPLLPQSITAMLNPAFVYLDTVQPCEN